MKKKEPLIKNPSFQAILTSLLCIILGLLIGYIVLLLIMLTITAAPTFVPYGYEEILSVEGKRDKGAKNLAPFEYSKLEMKYIENGGERFPHIFGTDEQCRDYFIRVIYGTRVSLIVGFFASIIVLIIGMIYGSISGYLGGKVDMVMMRIVDVIYSLPDMLMVILLSVVLGSAKQRIDALNVNADVYIINRENTQWLVQFYGNAWPFDVVVLDESSSFKNHRAKRFRALKGVRSKISRLIELTGTPSPHGLMDLWAQVYLLDGGKRLGRTITCYREAFFVPDQRSAYAIFSYKPRAGAAEAIEQAISDICISMKAADYLTLYNLFTLR